VRIKELEADIAALTNTTTTVVCSQCATELRQLNEQAVTAVPDIGSRGGLPPTFEAAEYIDESARYIQELLNQIPSFQLEEPRRLRECQLYNRLVESQRAS
jgi:hypothetical protein